MCIRDSFDVFALVAMHLHDAAEAILLAGALVNVHFALLRLSLIHISEPTRPY